MLINLNAQKVRFFRGAPFLYLIPLIALLLIGCAADTSNPPTATPVSFRTPQPVVSAESGINLIDWTYTPPWETNENSRPDGPNVVSIDQDTYEGWIVWRDDGFDLVWGDFLCSTAPELIIHADASMDFWPGEIVGDDCESAETRHKLSVQLETDVPSEQWQFTLHPTER